MQTSSYDRVQTFLNLCLSVYMCLFVCLFMIISYCCSACCVVISAGSGRVGSLSLSVSANHTIPILYPLPISYTYSLLRPYHTLPQYTTVSVCTITITIIIPKHTKLLHYHAAILSVSTISSPTLPSLSSTYHQLPILNIQAAAPQLMDIFTYTACFSYIS